MLRSRGWCGLALTLLLPAAAGAAPLTTALTYQGQLRFNGALLSGSYDLQFCLFAAASGGGTLGCAAVQDNVSVSEGRFTVKLDFGDAYDGEQKFVEIGVRDGASAGAFTLLTPRQELTAAPYALRAVAVARPSLRGYYQTSATFAGNAALTACAAGYHMATLAEIFDTTSLRYAEEVPGAVQGADSGDGPPYSITGWIRTGVGSANNNQVGAGNCSLWTSSNNANFGTTVGLNPDWEGAVSNISPWDGIATTCNLLRRVWCVEDLPAP